MEANVALSLVVAVEGAHAYSAFCPSIFTIRTFKTQPDTLRSIRDGEIMGSLFALGLGASIAALTRSAMPLYFAVATIVVMVGVYEWALRT